MGAKALLWVVCLGGTLAACNPFAPSLDDTAPNRLGLLGDRRSVKGFFEWFRNSYELRDTSLYGQMLTPDFSFSTRDFATGNQQIWDRDQEMRIATNMFKQVRSTSLLWTWFKFADTTASDTTAQVERYFTLTVQIDEQESYIGTGTAQLSLYRPAPGQPWQIRKWVDIRDF